MFYLYKRISSLLKKAFKEVYCTISVLHSTAASKKIGQYRKVILRYDYIASILLNTIIICVKTLLNKKLLDEKNCFKWDSNCVSSMNSCCATNYTKNYIKSITGHKTR